MLAAVLLVLVGLSIVLAGRRRRGSKLPLPPGPRRYPIIGNLLDMPTKRLAPRLRELGKKYGDLTYFDMLGQPMVIINTYEAAATLLEGRSANTSDRPRIMMAELTGFMWQFVLQGYAQEWRVRRKAFHSYFQRSAAANYWPIHLHKSRRFLQCLLDHPEDFATMAHHVFGTTIMEVVYGPPVSDQDNLYIRIAENAASIFIRIAVPGQYLVEVLPFLKHVPSWLPGAGFKRDAQRWRPHALRVRDAPYEATLPAMIQGTASPSMTSSLYETLLSKDGEISPEDEEVLQDTTALAYLTGADTSAYAARAMFLAMVQYPEVQKKVQQELDAIVGSDRLPDFSDRESLSYTNAVLKEVLRWHSIVPLGISHRAIEEDEYNGCRIPAGTILVPNAWGMSRDPDVYPEPEKFIPERFLEGGKYSSTAKEPERFQFGFGRRICPGRHFATDALFAMTVSFLHVYDIAPPLGEDGKPVPVPGNVDLDNVLSWPELFDCRITPRSKQAEQLIKK